MAVRGRVWLVGKWAGTAACLVLLMAWFICARYSVRYTFSAATQIRAMRGMIGLSRMVGPPNELMPYLATFPATPRWLWSVDNAAHIGLGGRFGLALPIVFISPAKSKGPSANVRWQMIYLPLWIPFVLVAVPTGLLWYRDGRRIPFGHCQRCGYDLT